MKYIELSHLLKDKIPVFPGDPLFSLRNISENEEYYLSELKGSLHSGTHIDSPLHYIDNGKKISSLRLDKLIGKSTVLKLDKNFSNENSKKIKIKNIRNITNIENEKNKIAILKTKWCDNWNSEEYFYKNPYLSKGLTKYLVKNNIKTLAIDTPSVDKWENSKIHKILLKNNINIIENLTNTHKLKKDFYKAYFIPLNINSEASFIRAFIEK